MGVCDPFRYMYVVLVTSLCSYTGLVLCVCVCMCVYHFVLMPSAYHHHNHGKIFMWVSQYFYCASLWPRKLNSESLPLPKPQIMTEVSKTLLCDFMRKKFLSILNGWKNISLYFHCAHFCEFSVQHVLCLASIVGYLFICWENTFKVNTLIY